MAEEKKSFQTEESSFFVSQPGPSSSCTNDSDCVSNEESDIVVDKSDHEDLTSTTSTDCAPDFKADEFYFETDHPALKANSDYRKLLFTVIVLEAERAQAIRDLDLLHDCRNKALADPIGFVEKLQKGEDLGIPRPQKIPEIPVIDWSKYTITNLNIPHKKRQLTRQSTKAVGDVLGMLSKPELREKSKVESSRSIKSSTPWTAEEQKKLESLLVEYPPEEIESRRWAKIASALGTRTPTQVASRVQKYFIKLLKAGLPIPGRQPNSCYLRKPRRQVIRQQPSTFWVSHQLPVFLNDNEGHFSSTTYFKTTNERDSDTELLDDEGIDPALKTSAEYQELLSIKKALNEKQQSLLLAQHIGFKCSHCEVEPIVGVRWHCTECTVGRSVDFCEDCVTSDHEIKHHLPSHQLEAIRHSSSASVDKDYMQFTSSCNYLDPNYMPAL